MTRKSVSGLTAELALWALGIGSMIMMGGGYRSREKRETSQWASDDPVASVALAEMEAWEGLTEDDPEAEPLLKKYWKVATGSELQYPGPGTAWSAAFISYVTNKGAPGSLNPSGSHMLYAGSALDGGPGEYRTIRPDVAPRVGDIILRERGTPIDFEDIGRGHKPSHGDVVVALQSGKAQVVGGNLSNTVEMREYQLRSDGKIAPGQRVVAILRRRKGNQTEEAAPDTERGPDIVANVKGYRHAKQSEVTPQMIEEAKLALSLPLGTVVKHDDGFAIAVVHHYKGGRRIKGAEVLLPVASS